MERQRLEVIIAGGLPEPAVARDDVGRKSAHDDARVEGAVHDRAAKREKRARS
jgi:hypothetical protein